ncbi:entericidin B membrane lipoprotein [Rhodobacteraceae bacterium THAF1]|nr:entericidin A/B family lipoprotein [Palleronia sp. THAF1]QFU07779.1 entericidin B membrane lipoprotein [Palleronia sp. THAF1]VDC25594.1 entericidin B membrane lipoprotein [Rhodobacteraceae bacterium THAF1]
MRITLAALLGLFTLTACETVGGAGEDIQSAGGAIENTAQDVQNDL